MYLTYADYQNMGGTLDEATFGEFEFEAEAIINWYTFNRLKKSVTYPPELAKCMYALIKFAQERQAILSPGESVDESSGSGTAAIASRSNDGVSISYNIMSASDLFNKLKTEMRRVVQMYLNGVVNELGQKLLYRGLYPGE